MQISKGRDPGRSAWCVCFHHPLILGANGKKLKIRKGLGTSDSVIADQIVADLNVMGTDPAWWSADRRAAALATFNSRAVEIFYDSIPEPVRDALIAQVKQFLDAHDFEKAHLVLLQLRSGK